MQITQEEFWHQEYRRNRNMKYLDIKSIEQRYADIVHNMVTFSEKEQIWSKPSNLKSHYWLQKFEDVLEECVLRGNGLKERFDQILQTELSKFSIPSDELIKIRNKYDKCSYLFKFGKLKDLKPTFENGSLFVGSASFYAKLLNQAQQDFELERSIEYYPSSVKIQHFNQTSGEVSNVEPISNVTINVGSSTDYYMCCLTTVFDFKLPYDIHADCCLIIKKPDRFLQDVFNSFDKKYKDWVGIDRLATYFDPLNTSDDIIDPFSFKHFKFSYQKELRVIWLPPNEEKDLEPIFLQIDNLKDYCDLVCF
ncbi:MAG: hypothetical protein PVG90_03170 [Bacillota bacterium]|jgi:hypothetical protein